MLVGLLLSQHALLFGMGVVAAIASVTGQQGMQAWSKVVLHEHKSQGLGFRHTQHHGSFSSGRVHGACVRCSHCHYRECPHHWQRLIMVMTPDQVWQSVLHRAIHFASGTPSNGSII